MEFGIFIAKSKQDLVAVFIQIRQSIFVGQMGCANTSLLGALNHF